MASNRLEQSLEDLESLIEIIIKYRKGEVDYSKTEPFDSLYTLNNEYHEQCGTIVIGAEGAKLIHTIAVRHMPNDLRSNVPIGQFSDVLKQQIFEQFVPVMKTIDKTFIQIAIDKSTTKLRRQLTEYTFYVPILFFSEFKAESSPFEYGGMKVHHLNESFKYFDRIQSERQRAKEFYQHFNAIVEVQVDGINKKVAYSKATRVIKAFLGVCKMLFPVSPSLLICPEDGLIDRFSYNLHAEGDSAPYIDSSSTIGCAVREGWREDLLSDSTYYSIVSKVLQNHLRNESESVLANRVVDALITYHDAFNENNSYFRVVKLVSAVERVYSTKTTKTKTIKCKECDSEIKIEGYLATKSFIEKGSTLLRGIKEKPQSIQLGKKLREYYGLRSEVLHGSFSFVEKNFPINTSELEELVAEIIACSTMFYFRNGIFKVTKDTELDSLYEKLSIYFDQTIEKSDMEERSGPRF
ncbi:hypothetical protein AB4379_06115, partial [Vibrio breoganii]